MAVSQVEVCNLALSRAGGHRIAQITSLGEASNEARQCAVKLPHLIRTALRAYPWRFATKKVVLAQTVLGQENKANPYQSVLSGQTENQNTQSSTEKQAVLYGTSFLYQYPEDCLVARCLYSAKENIAHKNDTIEQDFHLELAQDGTKLLLCNVSDAVLIYTAYVSDASLWDAMFTDALAWQLAAELCVSLGNDMQKGQQLETRALQAFEKAKTLDSKESHYPLLATSYTQARL